MAKTITSSKSMSGPMFTCCNILMCVIVLFVILYILGYTNVQVRSKEGMKSMDGGIIITIVIICFVIFVIVLKQFAPKSE